MTIRKLLVISLLAAAFLASSCSTTPAIRCDGKLSPINAPTAASKTPESVSTEATP